tara:strand:+ start:1944 stop:2321 length:378 start_codon:yes stop_codon:yes gene_type:complete
MTTIKEIKFESFEYDPNEYKELVNNLYDRFESTENIENKKYALKSLFDYKYYNPKTKVPDGRYVRWIMTKDSKNMQLSSGGFVAFDNGYSVVVVVNPQKRFKISKRNAIFFVKLNNSERIMATLS